MQLSDCSTSLPDTQAALQPVNSTDKLELVDQLTDYVSDALAEVRHSSEISTLLLYLPI